MKSKRSKWIMTLIVLAVNAVLWAIPSRLVYLVAQQREVYLGRYGETRMTALLLLIPISIAVILNIWSKEKDKRREQFKIAAIVIAILFSLIVVDLGLRVIEKKQYEGTRHSYHRVPNTVSKGVVHDVPEIPFSYPYTPPGYPDIPYTHTVDKRGFRNLTDRDQYDIIVIGDSFAEGSHVSDDQAWPVLLAEQTGKTVYNLGMSGGNPATYLETLKLFGLDLKPKIVICMIYEGNDFRASNFDNRQKGKGARRRSFFKSSPLRLACKRAMIRFLGPIGKNRLALPKPQKPYEIPICPPNHPLWALAWLPVGVPDGPNMKFYSFDLKRLLVHYVPKEKFIQSDAFTDTCESLKTIKQLCDQHQIRLIVAYAPDTPHVVLPLVKDRLNPAQVRAFLSLKMKHLPPENQLLDDLMGRLDTMEQALAQFCKDQQFEFISLTEPLRQKAAQGIQVYLSYNQHWTPKGNEVAASKFVAYLSSTAHQE